MLILAVLGLSGAIGLPGQAAAAKSEPSAVSEECAAQIAAAAAAANATAEDEEMAPCVEVDPSATAMDALNDPNCPRGGWMVTRHRACETDDYVLTVFIIRTRTVVGRMYYSIREDVRTTGRSARWTHSRQFILKPGWWGAVTGTVVTGSASCAGDCITINGNMPYQAMPALSGSVPTAEGVFESTISASVPIGYGHTTWRHYFYNPKWAVPVSNALSERVPYRMRCDDALPGYPGTGCVFDQVRPIHTISPALPSYYKHIRMSLSYNMPRFLTRLTDSFLQTQNRNKSCAPAPSPRPTGFQCDEYPFASTYQGAFTANLPWGRTFPGCQINLKYRVDMLGWNICMIPEEENRQGGLNLLAFYNDNRVIDRDSFELYAR